MPTPPNGYVQARACQRCGSQVAHRFEGRVREDNGRKYKARVLCKIWDVIRGSSSPVSSRKIVDSVWGEGAPTHRAHKYLRALRCMKYIYMTSNKQREGFRYKARRNKV
jgi:hypothetical protein